MKRSDDRILTSHTGSVFLPPRDDHAQQEAPAGLGAVSEGAWHDAVQQVVDKQVEVGLDVINDGDVLFGLSLVQSFERVLGGVEKRPGDPHRTMLKGLPDEDMGVFSEYYAQHPPFRSIRRGMCVLVRSARRT